MLGGRRRVIAETRRLRHPWRNGQDTRRVGAITPEQQDRFAEPRSTERGNFARTPSGLHESDQSRRRFAPLLGGGPMQISHPWQRRGAELSTELGGHGSPAVKHRARWCVARCASRSVPIEPLEIERSRTESEHPARDGACNDADAPRDARQRYSVGQHLRNGVDDYLDTGDLARQRVERQHALTVLATPAACQRHQQRRERVACLESSLDPSTSQPQIAAATASTTAARKDLVACTVDDRGVPARFDIEYENQVLMAAPG